MKNLFDPLAIEHRFGFSRDDYMEKYYFDPLSISFHLMVSFETSRNWIKDFLKVDQSDIFYALTKSARINTRSSIHRKWIKMIFHESVVANRKWIKMSIHVLKD